MAKKLRKKDRKKAKLGHFKYDPFLAKIGKNIKTLRKENGFTSSEHFAYDIDISRVGMQRYESSVYKDIRLRTLLKIIDGLGITPKEFFDRLFKEE